MRRRRLLGALCGLVFAAGCSEEATDPTVESPTAPEQSPGSSTVTRTEPSGSEPRTATRSPATRTATPDFRSAFDAATEDTGATVRSIEVVDRVVALEYVSRRTAYEELGAEIGAIAGGFFRQVERGWDVDRLESTIFDASETPQATWFAEVAWLEEFRADEISAEELSERILVTLEPVED